MYRVARRLSASICAAALLCLAGAALAQAAREKVRFESRTAIDPDVTVWGELSLPDRGAEKLPAVVVIHSSGGFEDRTRAPYVAALNSAGFATLELELFSRGQRPRSTRENLPHTYGALIYLARHPRIDPARIGVMGFSWGGALSLLTASSELTQAYTGGKYRFAAHLPLYPVCWVHRGIEAGKNRVYDAGTYRALTGAPLHILAGDKDDYDDPDSCPRFVQALPEADRKHVSVTVYPGATHVWDTPADRSIYDPVAHKGRGGNVAMVRNPAIAEKSKAFAVEFFSAALKPR